MDQCHVLTPFGLVDQKLEFSMPGYFELDFELDMKNDVQKSSSSLLRPKLNIIHIYDISIDRSSNRHPTY